MQVGLTRDELLEVIASKADDLSSAIRQAKYATAMVGGISDGAVDEAVSRISALTAELFKPPPSIGQAQQNKNYGDAAP